jgi:ribosomal protein S18 acetylase RimI-like enzyme
VTIRRATEHDLPDLESLWRALEQEVPPPAHVDVDMEYELAEIREIVLRGVALVAEEDGVIVGMALARRSGRQAARLTDLYVVPASRRAGVAHALLRDVQSAFAADGVVALELEVMASNGAARDLSTSLGFREELATFVAPLAELGRRLGSEPATGRSFGSIHVQTDDVASIVRAVEIYVPRLPGRSRGSVVTESRGGYVAVYDDACDRNPTVLRRLAREISTRTGLATIALGVELDAVVRLILFDRGSIVDEYVSVPEFHGPLPPGEVVALNANPVVIERVTGAAREAIRAATPVAASPFELPPPAELLARLANVLGLDDVGHGWDGAREIPGATIVDR